MKKIIVLLALIFAISGLFYFWWTRGTSAVNPSDKSKIIFVVKKGDGIREITQNLKEKGLIRDRVAFFLLIKKMGVDKKIEAGDFRLSPSMNASEIAENLTHGMLDIWVTVPEGKRAEEIAKILKENIPSYKDSWNYALTQNEGELFPDTYLIPRDADISLILSIMKNNFDKKYSTITSNSKLSRNEIITIASMVEREAKFPEDRPLIASVIYNRLNLGMPLQIDATVQYALGLQDNGAWWKKSLTADDLKIDSPYNTYKNTGLPPNPISNPGLSSLQAAANPANTDYLYYVSDKEGHNHYAKTLAEHNANIKKYGL